MIYFSILLNLLAIISLTFSVSGFILTFKTKDTNESFSYFLLSIGLFSFGLILLGIETFLP